MPGSGERPRFRFRPFGYRRADVDEVLARRDGEIAELRQDIAALWLAFARHDRMLEALTGQEALPPPSPHPPRDLERPAIEDQLSELDEVLAAIEAATRTLERTYAEEARGASPRDPGPERNP